MAYVGKTYKLERDDNFEAFIEALALPADHAEALRTLKPTHQLKKEGDTFSLVSNNNVLTFKSGVEFDENVGGLKNAKTTVTVDGDNTTQVQKFDDGKVITYKRVYTADSLVATITTNFWDGTATRYYTAV